MVNPWVFGNDIERQAQEVAGLAGVRVRGSSKAPRQIAKRRSFRVLLGRQLVAWGSALERELTAKPLGRVGHDVGCAGSR